MKILKFILIFLLIFIVGIFPQQKQKENKKMAIKLESSAFKEGEMIPSKYTCDGKNISPPLQWSGVPENAKSIAFIVDDPDAPMGVWVHWIIYNIPPTINHLEENISYDKKLKDGAIQGINDFRKNGYGGPCPPSGTHRYYFKIYALDLILEENPNMTKQALLDKMKNHILAEGQLMGKYKRSR